MRTGVCVCVSYMYFDRIAGHVASSKVEAVKWRHMRTGFSPFVYDLFLCRRRLFLIGYIYHTHTVCRQRCTHTERHTDTDTHTNTHTHAHTHTSTHTHTHKHTHTHSLSTALHRESQFLTQAQISHVRTSIPIYMCVCVYIYCTGASGDVCYHHCHARRLAGSHCRASVKAKPAHLYNVK